MRSKKSMKRAVREVQRQYDLQALEYYRMVSVHNQAGGIISWLNRVIAKADPTKPVRELIEQTAHIDASHRVLLLNLFPEDATLEQAIDRLPEYAATLLETLKLQEATRDRP